MLGEIILQSFGLRTIAASDKRESLINGVPVKLHGVNHHDTNPARGWCQSAAELRADLLLMKKLNITCVRTSHYPSSPVFLELCDQLGFYVVLETDIETNCAITRFPEAPYIFDTDAGDWPCTRLEWKTEFLERMQRAVLRDRNQCSIVFCLTGNECGYGDNQRAMLRWLKTLDDGRLRHCEDAPRAEDRNDVEWMWCHICIRVFPTSCRWRATWRFGFPSFSANTRTPWATSPARASRQTPAPAAP